MTENERLKTRIKSLHISKRAVKGDNQAVVYMMSRDQRTQDNDALLAAQKHAEAIETPLVVLFALYQSSNKRSREHVAFMLDGLREVSADLQQKNIPFIVQLCSQAEAIKAMQRDCTIAALYFDMSPLRAPRREQTNIAKQLKCSVYVVDAHNVVPLWVTSDKQEFAARTIRPKLHRYLATYLQPHATPLKKQANITISLPDSLELGSSLDRLDYSLSGIEHGFQAGQAAGRQQINRFISGNLKDYAKNRNDPSIDGLSELSPYLHFGQISARQAVLSVQEAIVRDNSLQKDGAAFIEEVVVRKELSDNFCYYNDNYDNLDGAADWARQTLDEHRSDEREFIYSYDEFKQAKTHDPAWNSAQLQLTHHGKMHGYMRMYWAKKVLEWTESPEDAIVILTALNDFYSLDGGDPNGYAGIMWSVAGVHDRPWQERPVYGKIRSMVYQGLKRKFDVQTYIDKYINKL